MSLTEELDQVVMLARSAGYDRAANWLNRNMPEPVVGMGPCEWCAAEGRRRKATHYDQLVPTCEGHAWPDGPLLKGARHADA